MSPDSKRGPRADATRNAARLVAAARELLDADGTGGTAGTGGRDGRGARGGAGGAGGTGDDIALDEVARRAGVGNATLYRHFPTRADLLVAVYADEVQELCRRGADLRTAPDPLDALFTWLDAFVVHVATKRPLAMAATDGADGRRTPLFEEWHASINAVADALVARARPALRRGVTATDVLALASGAAIVADAAHARRLVALLRAGLAAPD